MTLCSELADIEWLTSRDAQAFLRELAESAVPLHTIVAQLRDRLSPAQTHLLLEQVDLRRRAAAKFTRAENLFFTRLGLEQVHRRMGRRLQSLPLHPPASRLVLDPGDRRPLLRHRRRPHGPRGNRHRDRHRPRPHRCAIRRDQCGRRRSHDGRQRLRFRRHRCLAHRPRPPAERRRWERRSPQNDIARMVRTKSQNAAATASARSARRHQTRAGHPAPARMDRALRTRMDQPRSRMPSTRRLARQPRRSPLATAAPPSSFQITFPPNATRHPTLAA